MVNYGYISVQYVRATSPHQYAVFYASVLIQGIVVDTSIELIVFRDPTRRTYMIRLCTLLPAKS